MRAPKTTTLLVLAAVLFIVGEVLMTGYYPALEPVLGPDGSPLIGVDGRAMMGRDMASYYRVNAPQFALIGCSACLFVWWSARVSKLLYASFAQRRTS